MQCVILHIASITILHDIVTRDAHGYTMIDSSVEAREKWVTLVRTCHPLVVFTLKTLYWLYVHLTFF